MSLNRPLRFYELINSQSNVNFMLDLECDKLSRDHLVEAFKILKQRHPYFQMQVKSNPDGTSQFVHNPNLDEGIDIDQYVVTSRAEFDDWKPRLVKIGSNPDNLASLVRLELYSFENRAHRLYGCVNHAGIDGPGLFRSIRDLCIYLDALLSGDRPNIEARQFFDIHGKYEHSFDLEDLKKEPIITDIIESVKASDSVDKNVDGSSINSKFFQFDEKTTKNLITECKKNETTIQSVLSTAVMISHLNNKKVTTGKFLNSCPCCMRPYVGNLCADDVVCGSAALIWDYDVNLDDLFWKVAQKTKESIRQNLETSHGLKWWIKLANSIPTQSYSIMSSSMGVISLNEGQLKNLRINDLRFLGSAYKLPAGSCGTMTHAFTLMNRFTMNFSYTSSSLSDSWAQTYSNNIWKVFELIANGKLENVSIGKLIDQLEKH